VGLCPVTAWSGPAAGHQRARRPILTSKFWRPSFEARRCIVPASSYCEPNGQSPATWYWFALNGDDGRPLFAFPGIWQRWQGPVKKDGPNVALDAYAFLTTEPK
jgi:putative SOS response-associated peptidase YedK